MGLFGNLFGKQTCVLCNAEVGAMHREKIKNKEYVCNECIKQCSQFVRVSEMDKDTVAAHMKFMAHREQIYQQYIAGKSAYPSTIREYAVKFCNEVGMLGIVDKHNNKNKLYHEVIRFDEIASYEYYKEMNKPTQEGGQETFKEDGIILRVVQKLGYNDDMSRKGLRPHPYITKDIKLCFRKNEKDTNYADNAIGHLDAVFGKNDHSHGLFGGKSKAEKRESNAKKDMAKLMGGIAKAAVTGSSGEELQQQFAQTQQSVAAAQTDGLAVFSQRADNAENSVTL